MCQASDEPLAHWVAHHTDDGECPSRSSRSSRDRRTRDQENIDWNAHQLLCELGQAFGDTIGIAAFKNEVSTFDVSRSAQAVDDSISGPTTGSSVSPGCAPGGKGRVERPRQRSQQEAAAVHAGMVGPLTDERQTLL